MQSPLCASRVDSEALPKAVVLRNLLYVAWKNYSSKIGVRSPPRGFVILSVWTLLHTSGECTSSTFCLFDPSPPGDAMCTVMARPLHTQVFPRESVSCSKAHLQYMRAFTCNVLRFYLSHENLVVELMGRPERMRSPRRHYNYGHQVSIVRT